MCAAVHHGRQRLCPRAIGYCSCLGPRMTVALVPFGLLDRDPFVVQVSCARPARLTASNWDTRLADRGEGCPWTVRARRSLALSRDPRFLGNEHTNSALVMGRSVWFRTSTSRACRTLAPALRIIQRSWSRRRGRGGAHHEGRQDDPVACVRAGQCDDPSAPSLRRAAGRSIGQGCIEKSA